MNPGESTSTKSINPANVSCTVHSGHKNHLFNGLAVYTRHSPEKQSEALRVHSVISAKFLHFQSSPYSRSVATV